MAWAWPMGRALVPVGLAVLSPLAAALMITPAGLGAVLLVAAAAVVVPLSTAANLTPLRLWGVIFC